MIAATSTGLGDRSVAGALRDRLHRCLGALLPRPTDVALVGFPSHPNVGDAAIWAGERAYLRTTGHRVRFAADARSYAPSALRRRLPRDGVILLHGGGNLGDLWPEHQELRETVVRDFPDRRIVQLPQTVFFGAPQALAASRAVLARHPDLTVLCRDEASLGLARDRLEVRAELCPDAAFALGPLDRPVAGRGVLFLRRTDAEAAVGPRAVAVGEGVEEADWLEAGPGAHHAALRLARGAGRALARRPALLAGSAGVLLRGYDALAAARVRVGVGLLSRGAVVVTDRLHGHILCLLLDIPHVLLDNSYGKLSSFHRTWTQGAAGVHWADDTDDALAAARRLALRP